MESRNRFRFGPLWHAIGWAIIACIWWLSLTASPPHLDIELGDKLGHLLGYGGLTTWFCQLYLRTAARLRWAAGFIAMGIGLEFIQSELGYRTYEPADMVANTLGVLIGLAIGTMLGARLLLYVERNVLRVPTHR